MNDVDGEIYSPGQSPTTPGPVSSPAKDSNVRPHDMLKMMNPTPNGYSAIPNHKPKPEGQDAGKHHESKNNISHHKNSSDHVKKKEHDDSKHKSSSHSKPKEPSNDSSKKEGHEGHKEKHKSSHKESSKESSHKHSEHSKENSEKKEDKHKSDSVKKENSEGKPKTDNFKENEKVKDSSSKEHKEKHKEHKEKHKDKHKDKEHKDKHKDKEHKDKHKDKEHKEKHKDKSSSSEKHKDKSSSSEKPKEKSDKPKEKSDKPKEKSDKPKEKSDKPKEKSDKPKEPSEKPKTESIEKQKEKEKEKHKEKHKDKHSEKHKEKHKDKHKEKSKEKHEDKSKEKHEKSKEKHESKEKVTIKQEIEVEEPVDPVSVDDLFQKNDMKDEPLSEEDIPLSARKASMNASLSIKREAEDSDDEPISAKIEKKIKSEKKKKKPASEDEDYEDYEMEEEEEEEEVKPKKKRKADSDDDDDYGSKKTSKKIKKEKKEKTPAKTKKGSKVKEEVKPAASPTKRKKKEEEEVEVWKWWEEEKLEDGTKWRTLEHYGPVFAPPYERVPKNVKFFYDGKHVELSELTEEVAGFYGKMLDHDYTSKEVFNNNFFKDWRKVMTPQEKELIKDLKKCNFNMFNDYYKMKSEERKAMTKEQKAVIKKENEELTAKYGFSFVDGHKQKIGNFRIEPPGLFRGRGDHPKMGMLKKRIEAEDVLINIGKEAKVPSPPPGHKWKEVRHDNTVSWLASWSENILGSTKYVMLNPSSKLKGEKDWQKYETARKLKQHADRIREEYTRDFKSKEMKVRQRAVALYFIDKLALRAGNEKDEDTADTVGCCSLRVEHITLDDEKDGQEYVVTFDFLGKDSIRYNNSVAVEKRAYKNLKLFMENKQPGDDLFDRLNTAILNKYLNDLMEGLTAKVFRTYNASKTLQEQLDLLTKEEMSIPEKILAYNRANRAVAILCNHQRAVPKGFSKSMDALKQKMDDKIAQIKEYRKEVKQSKQLAKDDPREKVNYEKKKKRLATFEEQLKKLEVQATDREENKQIALGTSKLNYLDPRISVAWCKKWNVPIEKVYNKTQRDKFRWAIEMAGPDYKF